MVNPRQRRKSKAASHKKIRPSRHAQRNLKKMKPIRGPKVIQDAWDKKKTVRQNYDAMGLVRSLKPTDSGGTEKPANSLPQEPPNSHSLSRAENSGEIVMPQSFGRIIRDETGTIIDVQLPDEDLDNEGSVAESDQGPHMEDLPASRGKVVQALEELAQKSCPVQRHASESETGALKRLIAKYGHNYDAMAKDLRLNRWQRTSGQLQRACKKAGLV